MSRNTKATSQGSGSVTDHLDLRNRRQKVEVLPEQSLKEDYVSLILLLKEIRVELQRLNKMFEMVYEVRVDDTEIF